MFIFLFVVFFLWSTSEVISNTQTDNWVPMLAVSLRFSCFRFLFASKIFSKGQTHRFPNVDFGLYTPGTLSGGKWVDAALKSDHGRIEIGATLKHKTDRSRRTGGWLPNGLIGQFIIATSRTDQQNVAFWKGKNGTPQNFRKIDRLVKYYSIWPEWLYWWISRDALNSTSQLNSTKCVTKYLERLQMSNEKRAPGCLGDL